MQDVARIVVCDASRTFQAELKRFLEEDADLRVVESFRTPEQLLAALPGLTPDLVLLELGEGSRQALELTERIMRVHAVPVVLISPGIGEQVDRTAARTAGALEILARALLPLGAPQQPSSVALRRRIKRFARTRVRGGLARGPVEVTSFATPTPTPVIAGRLDALGPVNGASADGDRHRPRPSVIGIGASTGGPGALREVLAVLPADFPIPVLVVQHMAVGFTEGMVRWLDQQVPLRVAVAEADSPAAVGVWFAPDDAHLLLTSKRRLALDKTTRSGPHRPSVDVMLASLARCAGAQAVGVVLTGMGRDGAQGVRAIRARGGLTIAQDEMTSAVWGMPRAAADEGAELILALPKIGVALRDLPVREAVA